MAEALTVHLQAKLDDFLAGNREAKRELIAMSERRLLILARKQLRNFSTETEESAAIVSEAFLRLHRALDDVRPLTIRHYFALASLQIKRVLLDLVRVTGRRGKNVAGYDSENEFDPADSYGGNSRADMVTDLYEAMDKLDDELREIVQLLHFQGLTQAEVGQLLGVHEDTVKRKWAKARVMLAQRLQAFALEAA